MFGAGDTKQNLCFLVLRYGQTKGLDIPCISPKPVVYVNCHTRNTYIMKVSFRGLNCARMAILGLLKDQPPYASLEGQQKKIINLINFRKAYLGSRNQIYGVSVGGGM